MRGASRAHLPGLLSFELYALTNAIRHLLPHQNGDPEIHEPSTPLRDSLYTFPTDCRAWLGIALSRRPIGFPRIHLVFQLALRREAAFDSEPLYH